MTNLVDVEVMESPPAVTPDRLLQLGNGFWASKKDFDDLPTL